MTSMDREETDLLRSRLTGALIGLARATEGNEHLLSGSTAAVTLEGLFATVPRCRLRQRQTAGAPGAGRQGKAEADPRLLRMPCPLRPEQ